MIIEFAGLPGSGKTAIVRVLTAQDPSPRSAGLRRLNRADLARHPMTVGTHALRWRASFSKWTDKGALTRAMRRRISQELLEDDDSSLVLIDEGTTNYMWRSLFLEPRLRTEPWGPLLRFEYPLIALECERAALQARITAKPEHGRINRLLVTSDLGSDDWDRAEALFEDVLTRAASYRPVVRVDTGTDLRSATDRVRDALAAIPDLARSDR